MPAILRHLMRFWVQEHIEELQDNRRVMMSLIETLQHQLDGAKQAQLRAEETLEDLQNARSHAIRMAVDQAVTEVEEAKDRQIRSLQRQIAQLKGTDSTAKPATASTALPPPTPSYKLRLRARESIGSTSLAAKELAARALPILPKESVRPKRRVSLIPRLPSYSSSSLTSSSSENDSTRYEDDGYSPHRTQT